MAASVHGYGLGFIQSIPDFKISCSQSLTVLQNLAH